MQKISTKQMVLCAILACIGGILSGPLSFYFFTWKISLGSIPVMLAGILFGPVLGGMTGFASDFINFALAPRGGYNPIFGLTMAIMGIIAGLVYRRKDKELVPSLTKTAITAASSQLICSFLLNATIMVLLYGASPAIYLTRITYNLVMIPVNTVVLQLLLSPKLITRLSYI